MLEKLSTLLNRLSTGRNILILFFLFLLNTSVIFPLVASFYNPQDAQARKIDTQYYYSSTELYQIIGEYSDEGRRLYAISHATADVFFPLVYAFFFSSVITYTFRRLFRLESKIQNLKLIPFGLLVVDYLENICVIMLLLSYPTQIMWLAAITSIITSVKWLISVFTVFLFFVGIFGLIYLWLFRGRGIAD